MRRSPVVWPADLSGGNRTALAHAVALARFLDSTLHLLYIPHGSGDRARPQVGEALVHPVIADVINSAVRDLLPVSGRRVHSRIVAQRGMRGGLEEALLGSTTRAVLRRAKCPVLLVPMPERPGARKGNGHAGRKQRHR